MRRLRTPLSVVAVGAALIAGWWIAFGTFDPCAAMRSEAEAIAVHAGGTDGRAIHDALLGPQAPKPSGFACFATALSLKVRGRDAVIIVKK